MIAAKTEDEKQYIGSVADIQSQTITTVLLQ